MSTDSDEPHSQFWSADMLDGPCRRALSCFRGFAFVTYAETSAAEHGISYWNNQELMGRTIRVRGPPTRRTRCSLPRRQLSDRPFTIPTSGERRHAQGRRERRGYRRAARA